MKSPNSSFAQKQAGSIFPRAQLGRFSGFTARLAAPALGKRIPTFFWSFRLEEKKKKEGNTSPTTKQSTTMSSKSKLDAPQQFKQPSRKGKKAWRKNVDVTEVQEGLRMLKDEEIKGYVYI